MVNTFVWTQIKFDINFLHLYLKASFFFVQKNPVVVFRHLQKDLSANVMALNVC